MRYAQIKAGHKLHLVHEAGEEHRGHIIRKGELSMPLCGIKTSHYRMTINVPLAKACKRCLLVENSKRLKEKD